MKKIILKSFILLPLLSLSCAVKPPDSLMCVEMSMTRGECIKIVSGQKIRIDETNKYNGQTWWEMRPTNLVLPASSWSEQKKFLIKLCKKNKNMCDKEISSWDRSIQHIDENLVEKGVSDVPLE